MDRLTAVILAAGEAKRMRSRQPKVLHPLCGRPLIAYALRTARALADRTVVVAGPNADDVRVAAGDGVTFVEQRERLGTGHALGQARAACGDGPIVVLAADMPLLSSETLERLVAHHRGAGAAATVLTAGGGRPPGGGAVAPPLPRRTLDRLMAAGVTIVDPASTYIEDPVTIGPDTVVDPQVVIEGVTTFGTECVIGSGSHVTASRFGDRVTLKPYCIITDAVVEDGATLGPFCHLRPGCHIGAKAKVGNFAELKKSRIGRGSKGPHGSYAGDTTVGEDVNIGAGTVTCNYDGVHKHETKIADGAFIAAGSTITQDVPPGALAVARGQQVVKEGWAAGKVKKHARPEE